MWLVKLSGAKFRLMTLGRAYLFDLVSNFTEARIGRISASAYIVGTSGPDGDGNYTLDLASNVYTDPASLGSLPTREVSELWMW